MTTLVIVFGIGLVFGVVNTAIVAGAAMVCLVTARGADEGRGIA